MGNLMGKETRYKNFENIGYLKGDVQQEPKPSLNREMTLVLGIFWKHVFNRRVARPQRIVCVNNARFQISRANLASSHLCSAFPSNTTKWPTPISA